MDNYGEQLNQSNNLGDGELYRVGSVDVITGFDPATDVLDLGPDSIHNQFGVDTAEGFAMLHMFNSSKTTLLQGVYLKDLTAGNFAPIADAHLQQDLSAALAYENGTGLVRENTVYVRSHEAGLEEVVPFDPATDTISMFYLSVRGDQERNFSVEETALGVRFFSPITGQSLTLRDTRLSDLDKSHFEWRANQLEDNIAGRMGLASKIDGFAYENVYSGKSVAMAGLVDRAPYHSQPDYTGTPIGAAPGTGGEPGSSGGGSDDGETGGGTMDDAGDAGSGGVTTAGVFTPSISSQWGTGYNVETTFTPDAAPSPTGRSCCGWRATSSTSGTPTSWRKTATSTRSKRRTTTPRSARANRSASASRWLAAPHRSRCWAKTTRPAPPPATPRTAPIPATTRTAPIPATPTTTHQATTPAPMEMRR